MMRMVVVLIVRRPVWWLSLLVESIGLRPFSYRVGERTWQEKRQLPCLTNGSDEGVRNARLRPFSGK